MLDTVQDVLTAFQDIDCLERGMSVLPITVSLLGYQHALFELDACEKVQAI